MKSFKKQSCFSYWCGIWNGVDIWLLILPKKVLDVVICDINEESLKEKKKKIKSLMVVQVVMFLISKTKKKKKNSQKD
jgi:hypothetical protein